MGLLSNAIDRSMLKPGDHIYCYRLGHMYSHHGIYVGEDRVIHFKGAKMISWGAKKRCEKCGHERNKKKGGAVIKTCLDCFLRDHKLLRFEYEVDGFHFMIKLAGTCATKKCDPPHVVIKRANEAANDFGKYHLFENNCETFAFYCKTGSLESQQAISVKTIGKLIVEAVLKYELEKCGYSKHSGAPKT